MFALWHCLHANEQYKVISKATFGVKILFETRKHFNLKNPRSCILSYTFCQWDTFILFNQEMSVHLQVEWYQNHFLGIWEVEVSLGRDLEKTQIIIPNKLFRYFFLLKTDYLQLSLYLKHHSLASLLQTNQWILLWKGLLCGAGGSLWCPLWYDGGRPIGEAVALRGLDWGEDMVGVWSGLLWRGPDWKGLWGDRSQWVEVEGEALKKSRHKGLI